MRTVARKIGRNVLVAGVVVVSVSAFADEHQLRLKEAPGYDKVMANCIMCHSVDYVLMNSPFMKKAGWQATVNKMVKVMGAPIRPEDVPVIVDYLTKNYGVVD